MVEKANTILPKKIWPDISAYLKTQIFRPLFRSVLFILAYQKRKSEVSTWDRNSYLAHVILPMGKIKKKRQFSHEFGVHWLKISSLGIPV